MQYHICKFSVAVKHSYHSPAPAVEAAGYIKTVKEAIQKSKLDIIISIHEEIFYLAEWGDEIVDRPFAPDFNMLYRLHRASSRAWPGRARSASLHQHRRCSRARLNKGVGREALPWSSEHHRAPPPPRNRYCTYGVFRQGKMQAFATYPVMETIDGLSSV